MAVDEIRAIYEEYAAEVEKLVSEKKLADGLFGMGKKIADDPCHDRFSEKLGTFLKEYASGSPDPCRKSIKTLSAFTG